MKLSALWGGGEEDKGKTTQQEEQVVYLRDISNITRQRIHRLDHDVTVVGRKEEDHTPDGVGYLLIKQVVVGRRHAVIERKRDGFWITDCESVNGTFVNDTKLTEPVLLKSGDKVRFYEYEFQFMEERIMGGDPALKQAHEALGKTQCREADRSEDDNDDTLLYQ